MFPLVGLCFGMVVRLFRGRRSLLLENLALRQRLVALKRRHPRPSFGPFDKLFWVMEVRLGGVLRAWKPILIAIAAIFVGRILSVYTLVPFSNLFSKWIPFVWQHVLVWAGLRGALSPALALSLDSAFPYRDQILNLTFGVVVLSILVQGLSIKPVLGLLGLAPRGPAWTKALRRAGPS
jgi:NhaP-type Na+/H+ or K+/H+ antiporter